jgi:hypothetical protein
MKQLATFTVLSTARWMVHQILTYPAVFADRRFFAEIFTAFLHSFLSL